MLNVLIFILAMTMQLDPAAARAQGQAAVDELHARVTKGDGNADLLDRVCAQKDCSSSRLFWYTDLEEAKAAAQRTGRPIVSLHLLGRLDEELSCANSRFFRTILYSDESISSLLRDEFVLHWHSVRPVPQITIEFGDGRRIRQTITGNSAHYLLSPHGEPLDVLPGLYAPGAFREHLERWIDLYRSSSRAPESERTAILRNHHYLRLTETMNGWRALSARTGIVARPGLMEAAMRATSKIAIERPVLRQLELGGLRSLRPSDWQNLGDFEMQRVAFSATAIEIILRKQPNGGAALIENLRRTVAADTIFNEYELHATIHEWFMNGAVGSLASLNERVYAELFLTPDSDPWLGLKEPSIFTAIEE